MIRLDDLVQLLRSRGESRYGEDVTLLQHSLQAATHAEDASAGDSLVVAALFHDLGHALEEEERLTGLPALQLGHDVQGERLLEGLFGPEVSRPVGLHVLAKRYRCATEPEYRDALSAESTRSLEVQGGPLPPAEWAAFEDDPYFERALLLRTFDDDAKEPGAAPRPLEHFLELAARLIDAR